MYKSPNVAFLLYGSTDWENGEDYRRNILSYFIFCSHSV